MILSSNTLVYCPIANNPTRKQDNVDIDVSRGHNIPLSEIVEGATKKDMVGNTEYTPSSINLVNPPEIVSKAQPQNFEPVKTEKSITAEGTGGMLQGKKAFFTKSKVFKNMVDKAFVVIDADGSGEIDKKELYAGLILIHLRLAAYVGAAACRPASKEYVEEIFDSLDKDGTGKKNMYTYGMFTPNFVEIIRF